MLGWLVDWGDASDQSWPARLRSRWSELHEKLAILLAIPKPASEELPTESGAAPTETNLPEGLTARTLAISLSLHILRRVQSWPARLRIRSWDLREKLAILLAVPEFLSDGSPSPIEPAPHEINLTGGWTARSLAASVTLHILLLATPLPAFLSSRFSARPAAENPEAELQMLGNSRVLPPIYPARHPRRKPSPGGRENQPLPPPGAESVQRQTIVSNPPQPNHPRQTLLQQFGREKALLTREPHLPNMVIPPAPDASPKSEIDLRRLRVPDAPVDLTGPPRAALPPKPKSAAQFAMESARLKNLYPRLAVPAATRGEGSRAAPEVTAPLGIPRSGDLSAPGVLALSATPAAPSPVLQLPESNLRARIVAGPYAGSGSPGGVPGGVPGAEGGSGGGPGGIAGNGEGLVVPNVLVTPAGPVPPGPVIVGPTGGAPSPPKPTSSRPKPAQQTNPSAAAPASGSSPADRGRALMEAAKGGSGPGGPRRLYFTYIFIANLTSQSSSWLMQYAEQPRDNPGSNSNASTNGDSQSGPLTAPAVMQKVDPCYPSDARWERVEGSVLVYGVIRTNGSVEDVTVMRGISDKVDRAAAAAFGRSRFDPARKNGRAVEVEVLVEIPFRLAPCF